MSESLHQLADLLRQRAVIDHQIAKVIGYPAHSGHIGEFIAAAIFDIELNPSASYAAHDGYFRSGPLAGKSVNIKLYSKHDGLLDMVKSDNFAHHPDYYLVMAGPRGTGASSKSTSAPLCVVAAYLFDAPQLLAKLVERKVRINEATSVRMGFWADAMIYPDAANSSLALTPEQRSMLSLFAPPVEL